jgi:hypothetical protein
MRKANSPQKKVNARDAKEHLTEIEIALVVEWLCEGKVQESLPFALAAHLEECEFCRKAAAECLDFFLALETQEARPNALPKAANFSETNSAPITKNSIFRTKYKFYYAAAASIALLIAASIVAMRWANPSSNISNIQKTPLLAEKEVKPLREVKEEGKNTASNANAFEEKGGAKVFNLGAGLTTLKTQEGQNPLSSVLATSESARVDSPSPDWEAIEAQWSVNFKPIALLEALLNTSLLNYRSTAAAASSAQILIDTESVSPAQGAKIAKQQFFQFYLKSNNLPFNDKILLEIRKANTAPIRYELTGDSSGFYTQVFPENLEPGLYYWIISRGIQTIYLNKFWYYGSKG